jgi:DNA polymerase I-like protein with 3'-5' exonuclease and polymerase domains
MDTYVIDWESYYDKEYSLTKLSTEGYVNDPRFEAICIAVKKNNDPTQVYSGSHKEISKWLEQFDFESGMGIAHNGLFDYTILTWKFNRSFKLLGCTLSMARALHGTEVGGSLKALAEHYGIGEKGTEIYNAVGKRRLRFTEPELEAYMMYCKNDVDLTYELFKRLAPHFNKTEINLIDMTLRMFVEPSLELSVPILEDSLRDIQFRKLQALQDCGIDKTDLMSNKKFADVLRSLGVEPPMKTSPTTGKPTYAFAKKDEELLSLLEHPDFKVQTVVSSRLQVKETLEETKTQRLIEVAKRTKGKLPVGLKYYGAEVTGRWSAGGDGGALQLQNVARDSKIKEAIAAPEGYKIVGLDLSTVEVRVNLYIAGQQDQLDIITQGLDMYRDFGSKVFNVGYDEITKGQRFISKCAVLSLGFSSGHQVLCKSINLGAKQFGIDVNVDEKEAKRIVNLYREINHRVKDAWYQGEDVLEAVRDNEYYMYKPGFLELPVYGAQGIKLPSGLSIKYPKLARFKNEEGKEEWLYEGRRKVKNRIYGPKVLQNCTQSVARCVMGEAMARINKKYPIKLTVHDSCYVVVPEDEAQTAYDFMMAEMTKSPIWAPGLPLAAEGGIGDNLKAAG